MSDDTQNANTEPGDASIPNPELLGIARRNPLPQAFFDAADVTDDVLPPINVSRSYVDLNEPLALPGHCVVGDGMSDVRSTPPPLGAKRRIECERIRWVCEQLDADPWKLERIERLLGIHVTDPSKRERIGVVAVQLGSRPSLIENAETLIAMGS